MMRFNLFILHSVYFLRFFACLLVIFWIAVFQCVVTISPFFTFFRRLCLIVFTLGVSMYLLFFLSSATYLNVTDVGFIVNTLPQPTWQLSKFFVVLSTLFVINCTNIT